MNGGPDPPTSEPESMKHLGDVETTALPEGLGREFAADAPCVAVLVGSGVDAGGGGAVGGDADDEEAAELPSDHPGTLAAEPSRRSSATVYRVGEGYVVEYEGTSGTTETVGMGPGQLDAYVERVRRDDEWTVLSIADEGAGARSDVVGSRPESESPADR